MKRRRLISKCIVPNCTDEMSTRYRFPIKSENIKKIWLQRIGCAFLRDYSNTELYNKVFVCGAHFIDVCKSNIKLVRGSLPTINMPGFFGKPTVQASFIHNIERSAASTSTSEEMVCGDVYEPPVAQFTAAPTSISTRWRCNSIQEPRAAQAFTAASTCMAAVGVRYDSIRKPLVAHALSKKEKAEVAAENERVGDCSDEMETIKEEETRHIESKKILNFSNLFAAAEIMDKLQTLPAPVKRRIKALKKLQLEAANVEAKFFEEVHDLEYEYHKLYSPLYEKRFKILTGAYEPNDEECQWPSDDEEELSKDLDNKSKIIVSDIPANGIPEFWLTVFKNVRPLSDMVQEHDEPILKHLVDIKTIFIEKPTGFVLEFHFESNEYFTNTILTKEYDMKCVPDEDNPFSFEGPEIDRCRGCTINWNKGKNVTLKTVKVKQKHKSRGLVGLVTKTVQAESFFNFFSPPAVPDDVNEDDVDEDLRNILTTDFEIGHYLRESIVPRAVLYFTGEGLQDEDFDDEGDEDSDNENRKIRKLQMTKTVNNNKAKLTIHNIGQIKKIETVNFFLK